MKIRIILSMILFTVFLLSSPSAYAENSEWKDREFIFDKTSNLLILWDVEVGKMVKYPYAERIVQDIIVENFRKKNIMLVPKEAVIKNLESKNATQGVDLEKADIGTFCYVFDSSLGREGKNNYKLLVVQIAYMGYSSKYIEPYVIPTTQYHTANFNIQTRGNSYFGQVQYPVDTYQYVPGQNVEVSNAGLMLGVYDPRTHKYAWLYSDLRDRVNNILNNSTPEEMMKRIATDAAKKLSGS